MNIEIVKVADLITPEENIRKHPEKQLEELARSYKMFGQFRPVVIDENNYIWAGNGLVEALRRIGEEHVNAYRYTGLTDAQKKKLMLADNKTFALGFDNLQAIDNVMKSLDDFDIPGYDEGILEQLYTEEDKQLEEIAGMGKALDESIESIQKTVEKREAEVAPAQVIPSRPPEVKSGEEVKAEEHEPDEKAKVRKYVLCPKCGEKIWL